MTRVRVDLHHEFIERTCNAPLVQDLGANVVIIKSTLRLTMRLNINRSVEHNDYISLTVARGIALNDISNAECCEQKRILWDNHRRKHKQS